MTINIETKKLENINVPYQGYTLILKDNMIEKILLLNKKNKNFLKNNIWVVIDKNFEFYKKYNVKKSSYFPNALVLDIIIDSLSKESKKIFIYKNIKNVYSEHLNNKFLYLE